MVLENTSSLDEKGNDVFGDQQIDRRMFAMGAAASLFAGVGLQSEALAQSAYLHPLRGDDGKRVVNYRLPSQLSVQNIPGVIWVGSRTPDVVIAKFFDFNCPYCHRAMADLAKMMRRDKNLRVGLVNNAVLSPGSFLAARVQQSVMRLRGPRAAYTFTQRLLRRRGRKDGRMALAEAAKLGLKRAAVEKSANSDVVGKVLVRQMRLAESLAFVATPSFIVHGVGILGYPGPNTMTKMIADIRKCDKVMCRS